MVRTYLHQVVVVLVFKGPIKLDDVRVEELEVQPGFALGLEGAEDAHLGLAVELERDGRPRLAVSRGVDTTRLAHVDALVQVELL